MGWDDVLSILYLLKNPDIDILGITVTGCGKTHLDDGVQLALALMELGNRDAAVCAGTGTPTSLDHRFPEEFRNDMDRLMGLRKTLPKVTRKVDPRPAWDFISETL
ncbi:MAG: nucleoside hydrolase, partial [Planctomycetes bacterium]|nr:nucleoside hydrolase [Planctomycetota bacterium]